MLPGMPYACTMGLQGSPVKPVIIPFYLNRNGQAITLTKALLERGVKTARAASAARARGEDQGQPHGVRDDVPLP
jgi:nitrate/nitrite transport system substrate-binding protein